MTVYFPTIGGDVNLKPDPADPKRTLLTATKQLTESERGAIRLLLKKYKVTPKTSLEGSEHTIPTSLAKAAVALKKVLKAKYDTITAVKLTDGRIEEVKTSEVDAKAGARAAAVVDVPPKRCPLPVYSERDVRASAVLNEFLNPLQRADFERLGAFTAVGCDSGHSYMICHRHSPTLRDGVTKTLLRDLNTFADICTRDIGLPASEECLALLFMVTCRENEWLHSEGRPWRSLDN